MKICIGENDVNKYTKIIYKMNQILNYILIKKNININFIFYLKKKEYMT